MPALAAALSIALAFPGCRDPGSDADPAGPGPDTTAFDSGIFGRLVEADGSPGGGALVSLLQANPEDVGDTLPYQVADTVRADARGWYRFPAPGAGSYTLLATRGDDLGAWLPGLAWRGQGALDLGTDTLSALGSIQGRVVAFPDDPESFGGTCFLQGTHLRSPLGDSGTFRLAGVPPGRWDLRCRAMEFLDTVMAVDLTDAETLELTPLALRRGPNRPPRAPGGLTGTFDSLTWKVDLAWHQVRIRDLAGYGVFRAFGDGKGELIAQTRDTVFQDDLLEETARESPGPVSYWILTLDAYDAWNTSAMDTVTLAIRGGSSGTPVIRVQSAPKGLPHVMPGERLGFSVTYAKTAFPIVRILWEIQKVQGGVITRKEILRDTSAAADGGRDSLEWMSEEPGKYLLKFYVDDMAGRRVNREFELEVTEKRPKVDLLSLAGGKADYEIGDTLNLRAVYPTQPPNSDEPPDSPTNRWYSRIVSVAWDLDESGIFRHGSSDTSLVLGEAFAGARQFRVRVSDTAGLTGEDTLRIAVHYPPIASYTRLAAPPPFTFNPDSAEVLSLDSTLFVIGVGLGVDEIWRSQTGTAWTKVEPTDGIPALLKQAPTVVFQKKLWLLWTSAWGSRDGASWEELPYISMPGNYTYAARGDRICAVQKRPASGYNRLNDFQPTRVSSTLDGIHWETMPDLPFFATDGELFEHQNRLYFVGWGYPSGGRIQVNAIYRLEPGENWTSVEGRALGGPYFHNGEVVSYRGELMAFGWTEPQRSPLGDRDTWVKQPPLDGKAARCQTVVHRGRVYIFRAQEIWVSD